MERRRESRVALRQLVTVTDLSTQRNLDPSEIVDYSGRGMALLVSSPVATSAAIQIDWQGMTLLGYVCYQNPFQDRFRIGLRLDHVMAGGRDIAQLLRRLQEEISVVAMVPQG